MAGPSTPVRDELDAMLSPILQEMYENLSGSGTPPTPGRGLVFGSQAGSGNHQYICTGTFAGQYLPEYRCTQTYSSAPMTPTTRSGTTTGETTGAERKHSSSSGTAAEERRATAQTNMRDKREPKRAAKSVPEKGKKRKRSTLPPEFADGQSDDENWCYSDRNAIDWYVELLTSSLNDPDYEEGELEQLRAAWKTFKVAGECRLDPCPLADKTFSTLERYARHLVEYHLHSRPVFGCSETSQSRLCVPLPGGRRFHHPRRGQLVRHLATVHQLGAEKALEYVTTIWKYPSERDRPVGISYPRTIYYRWEENMDAPPLCCKNSPEVSAPTPPKPAKTTPKEPVPAREATPGGPEGALPTPPEPTRLPTPPEPVTGDLPQGRAAPSSSPKPTGRSTPQGTPTPLPIPDALVTQDESPRRTTLAVFAATWEDLGRKAQQTLNSSLEEFHQRTEERLRTVLEESATTQADLEAALRTRDAALSVHEHQVNSLCDENKRLKQELSAAKEEITFAKAEAEALRLRYDTANRKFVKVTGVSLETWDGTVGALKVLPKE